MRAWAGRRDARIFAFAPPAVLELGNGQRLRLRAAGPRRPGPRQAHGGPQAAAAGWPPRTPGWVRVRPNGLDDQAFSQTYWPLPWTGTWRAGGARSPFHQRHHLRPAGAARTSNDFTDKGPDQAGLHAAGRPLTGASWRTWNSPVRAQYPGRHGAGLGLRQRLKRTRNGSPQPAALQRLPGGGVPWANPPPAIAPARPCRPWRSWPASCPRASATSGPGCRSRSASPAPRRRPSTWSPCW